MLLKSLRIIKKQVRQTSSVASNEQTNNYKDAKFNREAL